MSSISNRKSVMAVTSESTEGTPVVPTTTADFIPLQEGFSVAPSFDELKNAELTGSIGTAKSILGKENPTVTVSSYVKHSGTEGTAPRIGKFLKALFGTTSSNATERSTTTGSSAGTASARGIVKLAAGGSDFSRGKAILLKDSVNGYEIRNVFSNSTVEELNLNFNLDDAPAAGVACGKCVNYSPAESAHETLTTWIYRGNGGAVEMVAGVRPVSGKISAKAGEFINAEFNLEGIEYFFNPIVITAANDNFDFTDSDGTNTCAVANDVYKDPVEFASALKTALDGASTDTFTVTYSSTTGKFTITSDGSDFHLDFVSGPNTPSVIGPLMGFDDVVSDYSGALTYTSDSAFDFSAPVAAITYDTTQPLVAKANQVRFGSFDSSVCFAASNIVVNYNNTKTNIESVCATSGVSGSIFSARMATIELTALIDQYDVDKFYRFNAGSNVEFMYNFGEKSGGNWVAGKSCNVYIPTSTITKYEIVDADGLATLNMTLSAYVADGLGEIYVNFL